MAIIPVTYKRVAVESTDEGVEVTITPSRLRDMFTFYGVIYFYCCYTFVSNVREHGFHLVEICLMALVTTILACGTASFPGFVNRTQRN